jgi:FkbM family methyltransferase
MLRPFGVRLQRLASAWFVKEDAAGIEAGLATPWIEDFQFQTVVDVGAHEGLFSEWALRKFPRASVVAFEPQRSCYETLVRRFAGEARFKAFHTAVGATEGNTTLFRNRYGPASSLLKMAPAHVADFPFTGHADDENVPVAPLDRLVEAEDLKQPLLVKIDVQGYEGEVLKGGAVTLRRADLLIVELSLEPLYDGQPLFDLLYPSIVALGFRYRGNAGQLRSPRDGRTLQVDAMFSRSAPGE